VRGRATHWLTDGEIEAGTAVPKMSSTALTAR
jgi:hypothetical protein